MRVSVVIPARMGSTRLAGKMLLDLGGKPVLWHAWNAASKMRLAHEVIVATDDERIGAAVQSWGGIARMTAPTCNSGMERIASMVDTLKGDFIINVQGDEPFIQSTMLDALVEASKANTPDIMTPIYPLKSTEALQAKSVVKVARAHTGQALYFSRSPIPCVRDLPMEAWLSQHVLYGHIGVYGARRDVLENYKNMPPSALEAAEYLEQLRFMEYGYRIQTIITDRPGFGIDTPEDLEKARELLKQYT